MDSNRQRRILMILENQSYPDDCRVLLEARALKVAGYEMTVICPTGMCRTKYQCIDGVHVYRYPQPPELGGFVGYVVEYAYSMAMAFCYAWYVLFRRGFDAIHIHTPPDMNVLIAICFQLLGKRFVLDHHDLSPELYQAQRAGRGSAAVERVLLWFERLACRRANQLISTNESQRRIQTGRGGADPQRCYIVRNGPDDQFLRDVLPIPEFDRVGKLTIGYVGVIGIQDGVDYLIRALHLLKSDLDRTDFHAVIVGPGTAVPKLKLLVAELELGEFVTFTGNVPFEEVPRYIAAFDICTTPDPSNSYNDSCTTIKTMEYMALRKPTVCFTTRENELTAGDSALYAKNNDVGEFAQQIRQLMDDPLRREELGRLGRKRIDDFLSWKRQQVNLLSVYEDVFGGVAIGRPPETLKDGMDAVDHAPKRSQPVVNLPSAKSNVAYRN